MTVPVVDRASYDALACSRCGDCCEGFYLDGLVYGETGGALGIAKFLGSGRRTGSFDQWAWLGQLEPWWDAERETWRYRCGHFSRDAEGAGVCGIYETRPSMCSEFPYGMEQGGFDRCVWNVTIFDYDPVLTASPLTK